MKDNLGCISSPLFANGLKDYMNKPLMHMILLNELIVLRRRLQFTQYLISGHKEMRLHQNPHVVKRKTSIKYLLIYMINKTWHYQIEILPKYI